VYEIANRPKDAHPQEVYVHNRELGEQVKFTRKERFKTAAGTIEDDGKSYI
jgi:hypothetical protein